MTRPFRCCTFSAPCRRIDTRIAASTPPTRTKKTGAPTRPETIKLNSDTHAVPSTRLVNAHISQYSHGNRENHLPVRNRKLLLHRREIDKLQEITREKGLALIPTKIYLKNGKVKCEIAVAKGKKLYDKREADKARTADAEARAEMRRRA